MTSPVVASTWRLGHQPASQSHAGDAQAPAAPIPLASEPGAHRAQAPHGGVTTLVGVGPSCPRPAKCGSTLPTVVVSACLSSGSRDRSPPNPRARARFELLGIGEGIHRPDVGNKPRRCRLLTGAARCASMCQRGHSPKTAHHPMNVIDCQLEYCDGAAPGPPVARGGRLRQWNSLT